MNTDLLSRYLFAIDWFFLATFAIVVTAAGLLVFLEDLFRVPNVSQPPANTPAGN